MIYDDFKQLSETISAPWVQQAFMQLNQCQQEIKWTNSPKVFIEIAVLTITNRYHDQEESDYSIDSEAMVNVTDRLAQLEKEFNTIKQTPTSQSVVPQERRPAPRT